MSPSQTFPLRLRSSGLLRGIASNKTILSGHISLDGVVYPTSSSRVQSLEPMGDWVSRDPRREQLTVVKKGRLCVMSGVLKIKNGDMSNWDSRLTNVSSCRPKDGRLIFSVPSGRSMHRVDVSCLALVPNLLFATHDLRAVLCCVVLCSAMLFGRKLGTA